MASVSSHCGRASTNVVAGRPYASRTSRTANLSAVNRSSRSHSLESATARTRGPRPAYCTTGCAPSDQRPRRSDRTCTSQASSISRHASPSLCLTRTQGALGSLDQPGGRQMRGGPRPRSYRRTSPFPWCSLCARVVCVQTIMSRRSSLLRPVPTAADGSNATRSSSRHQWQATSAPFGVRSRRGRRPKHRSVG